MNLINYYANIVYSLRKFILINYKHFNILQQSWNTKFFTYNNIIKHPNINQFIINLYYIIHFNNPMIIFFFLSNQSKYSNFIEICYEQ